MPKVKKDNISKTSKRNSLSYNEKISMSSEVNDPSWAGLVNAQGLPALPFAAIPPSVDVNLVMALAQVMTMNALSTLSQNQTVPQNNIQVEKAQKKELMLALQEKLKNRKSYPPPPVVKKKKARKDKLSNIASSSESPSNLSNLEILALATTAHQATDQSPETSSNHRGSFSHLFESDKSPGLLTALQSGFPNIDWNKLGSLKSPSSEILQSILSNVSDSERAGQS